MAEASVQLKEAKLAAAKIRFAKKHTMVMEKETSQCLKPAVSANTTISALSSRDYSSRDDDVWSSVSSAVSTFSGQFRKLEKRWANTLQNLASTEVAGAGMAPSPITPTKAKRPSSEMPLSTPVDKQQHNNNDQQLLPAKGSPCSVMDEISGDTVRRQVFGEESQSNIPAPAAKTKNRPARFNAWSIKPMGHSTSLSAVDDDGESSDAAPSILGFSRGVVEADKLNSPARSSASVQARQHSHVSFLAATVGKRLVELDQSATSDVELRSDFDLRSDVESDVELRSNVGLGVVNSKSELSAHETVNAESHVVPGQEPAQSMEALLQNEPPATEPKQDVVLATIDSGANMEGNVRQSTDPNDDTVQKTPGPESTPSSPPSIQRPPRQEPQLTIQTTNIIPTEQQSDDMHGLMHYDTGADEFQTNNTGESLRYSNEQKAAHSQPASAMIGSTVVSRPLFSPVLELEGEEEDEEEEELEAEASFLGRRTPQMEEKEADESFLGRRTPQKEEKEADESFLSRGTPQKEEKEADESFLGRRTIPQKEEKDDEESVHGRRRIALEEEEEEVESVHGRRRIPLKDGEFKYLFEDSDSMEEADESLVATPSLSFDYDASVDASVSECDKDRRRKSRDKRSSSQSWLPLLCACSPTSYESACS